MPVSAAALQVVVSADIRQALSGLKQVSSEVAALGKRGATSVAVKIDVGHALGDMKKLTSEVNGLSTKAKTIPIKVDAKGALSSIEGISHALTGLQAGVGLVMGAFNLLANVPAFAAGALGVDLAIELENTTGAIQGITKDTAKTTAVLAMLRKEADQTPFAFVDLAKAYAGLAGPARSANLDIMSVIKTAEVLASANPAQGLEGAIYSLKGVFAGSFESVVDRFDLNPATVNKLKAAGVAPIEIVNQALLEQGKDAKGIDAMALTFQGRMSTFTDAIDSIRVEAGKPILTALTVELERFTGILGLNSAELSAWATTLGTTIGGKIREVGEFLGTVLQTATNIKALHNLGLPESLGIAMELRIGEVFGPQAQGAFHAFIAGIQNLPTTLAGVGTFLEGLPKLIDQAKAIAAEMMAAIAAAVADLRLSIAKLTADLLTAVARVPGLGDAAAAATARNAVAALEGRAPEAVPAAPGPTAQQERNRDALLNGGGGLVGLGLTTGAALASAALAPPPAPATVTVNAPVTVNATVDTDARARQMAMEAAAYVIGGAEAALAVASGGNAPGMVGS